MQIQSPTSGAAPWSPVRQATTASDPAGQQVPGSPRPTSTAMAAPGQFVTAFVASTPFAQDTLHSLISAQAEQDQRDALSKDLFAQFDANKDNRLSLDELTKALSDDKAQIPARLRAAAEALKARLSASSAPGEMSLGRAEVTSAVRGLDLPASDRPPTVAALDAAVHALDKNGDNVLSDDEIRAALSSVGQGVRPYGMSLDFVARSIATLNTNGDKGVTPGEIHAALDPNTGASGLSQA